MTIFSARWPISLPGRASSSSAPDLTSGLGPNGGNYESFRFPDEAWRANLKIPAAEAMRRYRVAYDFAMKHPRANGKIAALGSGLGGTYAFRFAAGAPKLNAAVVFYGSAPDAAVIAKIKAPVLGLYGADDPVETPARVEQTAAEMKKAGKTFEYHIIRALPMPFSLIRSKAGTDRLLPNPGRWPWSG